MSDLPIEHDFRPPVPIHEARAAELVPAQEPFDLESEGGSSSSFIHVFLVALRRWGLLTVPTGLALAIGAAALIWWMHEPSFESSAWFQVSADNKVIDFATSNTEIAHGQFVQTQVELVRSPLVLGPVIQKTEIAGLPEVMEQEAPLEWLRENIKVLAVGQSEFLQIQFRSRDKETARLIVQAVSQQYLEVHKHDSDLRRQEKLRLIQEEKNLQATEITIQRNKVRMLYQNAYGKDPFLVEQPHKGVPAGSGDEMADALHRMRLEAAIKKEMLEANLRAVISQFQVATEEIPADKVDELFVADRELAHLRASLAQKESQLNRLTPASRPTRTDPLANPADEDHPVTGADRRKMIAELEVEIDHLMQGLSLMETERRSQIREDLELAACREALADRVPKASADDVRVQVDSDPEVQRLTARVEETQAEVKKYRDLLARQKNHAALRRLATELKERRQALDDYRQTLTQQLVAGLNVDALREQLTLFDQLVAEVRQARSHHAVLRQKLAAATSQRSADVERVGEETIDLEFARQALDQAMEMHQLLAEQLIQLKTESRAPDRVILREKASVAGKPVEGLPIRNMILAALVAAAFPCGLATLWEWHVERISDADQFALELGIPVLGEITRLPGTQRAAFSSAGAHMSRAAALYEQSSLVLSDNISQSSYLRNVQVMAVSSAVKGEGKSHLAAKLALNLARVMPDQVLLVDGDIRFRSVERLFDIPSHAGLVDALQGEYGVEDVIHETSESGLHVITAGLPGQRSYDLLRNGVLPAIMDQLRKRYKYIIIDTPPILSAGEAVCFGKVADGTLICALRDFSRIPRTRKALNRLFAVGVRPLGAILVGVPASCFESSSCYGYLPELELEEQGA